MMAKIGILLHVYHLETRGWDMLVWGNPANDKLGTGTTFIELLLDTISYETVESVICSGPSRKNNLPEGAYTKQFLLERYDHLTDFSRLKHKLDRLTPQEHSQLFQRLRALHTGPAIKNTVDEVTQAAKYFNDKDVRHIVQIASASHAPRCLKTQLIARQQGAIPSHQQWFVAVSDTYFTDTNAQDIIIIEPPHRGDDAMTKFTPSLSRALQPYFDLPDETKKQVIQKISETISNT